MLSTKGKKKKKREIRSLESTPWPDKIQDSILVSRSKIDRLKAAENTCTVIAELLVLQTILSTSYSGIWICCNTFENNFSEPHLRKNMFVKGNRNKKNKSYLEVLSLVSLHYPFNRSRSFPYKDHQHYIHRKN